MAVVKMEVTCSRCKKTHLKTVQTVAEGQAFDALEKLKAQRLVEISEFFEKIPTNEMPDFMVISGGESGLVHASLCDPEGDAKRSCKARVAELMKQAGTLEERKPRSPNKKTVVAEEAITETKPAE